MLKPLIITLNLPNIHRLLTTTKLILRIILAPSITLIRWSIIIRVETLANSGVFGISHESEFGGFSSSVGETGGLALGFAPFSVVGLGEVGHVEGFQGIDVVRRVAAALGVGERVEGL